MQQSDYILREIEKISIMLLGMLGKMVQRKKEGIELKEDEFSSLNSAMHVEAGFDADDLLKLPPGTLGTILNREKGFDERNTELIAELLEATGDLCPVERKKKLYMKALEIYRYLDSEYSTFSFHRNEKIASLEFKLKSG